MFYLYYIISLWYHSEQELHLKIKHHASIIKSEQLKLTSSS